MNDMLHAKVNPTIREIQNGRFNNTVEPQTIQAYLQDAKRARSALDMHVHWLESLRDQLAAEFEAGALPSEVGAA